ncbi:MAG: Fe-S cluster assembly protein SufD [Candidatus Nanopelagicales bacterium]
MTSTVEDTTAGTAHRHGGAAPALDLSPQVHSVDPADFPVPTGREEEWRFTPLERLRGLLEGPPAAGDLQVGIDAADGVAVDLVGRDDPRLSTSFVPADRASALAWAAYERAVVVSVPAELEADRATTITLRGVGGDAAGHVLVEVGRHAHAVVVLHHQGTGSYTGNVDVVVGDGASLTLVSLQEWDDDAVHLGTQNAVVGRDATFRSVVVTLGGDVVRLVPTVSYEGPGGSAELLGVFFADAGQHLEHRLFVDHAVPHCRSDVVYKGALQGDEARTVWVGDVLIRAAAVGTDTYEINRNLLLTDGARADSVPNLEIETGEVAGAGHASATGRFDDEQLFYLQARGIDEATARRMVVRGFFQEVLARIGLPELETRLVAAIDAELGYDDVADGGEADAAVADEGEGA